MIQTVENETCFLPSARSSKEILAEEIQTINDIKYAQDILNGFPGIVVILNNHRQIVGCNDFALQTFGCLSIWELEGKRIGEAINCIHSFKSAGGCGTSVFCTQCGAAKAISQSTLFSKSAEEECRITANVNGVDQAFDFYVYTQILKVGTQNFTMVTLKDISNKKRREALEKIFFHDVINTVSAARMLAEVFPEFETKAERENLTKSILLSIDQLLDEITAQREIFKAENGDLQVKLKKENLNEIINKAASLYFFTNTNRSNKLNINIPLPEITILTDAALLIRCIGNLLKNAIEASSENDQINFIAEEESQNVVIKIQNPGVIPENVKLQLFQRSFSTKCEKGRGICLYSVKLIIEQYLKGKVSFVSEETTGTVFIISLKKNPD